MFSLIVLSFPNFSRIGQKDTMEKHALRHTPLRPFFWPTYSSLPSIVGVTISASFLMSLDVIMYYVLVKIAL